MYESYIKKTYGNKATVQEVPVDKRKLAVMERLHKKLESRQHFQ